MGIYLNSGNSGFAEIVKTDYVDKTGLIALINKTIGTKKKLTCISRPRRFGKSYAAQMLCAYYDNTVKSEELFSQYVISQDNSFHDHLNKYHVINLDITNFISEARQSGASLADIPSMISDAIKSDVEEFVPGCEKTSLNDALIELVKKTNTKIIFVIDEWDSMIRETGDDVEAQERYLNLLRGWFKNNNFTPIVVAAAYMTGILPIKKDGTESAISDFQEYSMLDSGNYSDFVGFTEKEVKELCDKSGRSFDIIKKWYDGYSVGNRKSVYNPYSVMRVVETGKYKSYWKKTSAAETLMTYIDMDQDGLQEEIVRLISGEKVIVDTDSFKNDVDNFTCKDDVLTLLIHLGYLTYEERDDSYGGYDAIEPTGFVHIPNEEVRGEFNKILRKANHKNLIGLVQRSDVLLNKTIDGDDKEVAKAIQEIHDSECAPTFYNDEQSLRYVIKMAYLSCVDQYARIEELPSGHGIADVAFVPKRGSNFPAMIIELKWNKTSDEAMEQIYDRNYISFFKGYGGDVILVGINYDEKTKIHSCKIEKKSLGV